MSRSSTPGYPAGRHSAPHGNRARSFDYPEDETRDEETYDPTLLAARGERPGRLEDPDATVLGAGHQSRVEGDLVQLLVRWVVERSRTVTVGPGRASGRGARRGRATHATASPASFVCAVCVRPVMPVPPGS